MRQNSKVSVPSLTPSLPLTSSITGGEVELLPPNLLNTIELGMAVKIWVTGEVTRGSLTIELPTFKLEFFTSAGEAGNVAITGILTVPTKVRGSTSD